MLPLLLLGLAAPGPTIFIDPGHGVGANKGAITISCLPEQTITLNLSKKLAEALQKSGKANALLARTKPEGPSYKARIKAAQKAHAALLLSVHIDSRGPVSNKKTAEGKTCPHGQGHRGFAVLYSTEGSKAMNAQRLRWARRIASALKAAGLPAYDGADYKGLYTHGPEAGLFIDGRGLMMLRRPSMPSVILEVYHALDPAEYAQWQKPATIERWLEAMVTALTTPSKEALSK